MAILSGTCPHCFKENVTFQSVGDYLIHESLKTWTTFFICNNCTKGVMASIQSKKGNPPHDLKFGLEYSDDFKVLETYPTVKLIDPPKFVPDNIKNFYIQAVKAFRSGLQGLKEKEGGFDASAMMCRKVLEATCKHLDLSISGNLKERINKLSVMHLITDIMKDWAHEIRLDGNSAAHEDDPIDMQSTKDLLSFTELFLMYAFTLPGMVAERRLKP